MQALELGAGDARTNLRQFARYIALALENLYLVRDLEQRNAVLAQSNRDLKQFAYAASHDLQAPLPGG